MKQGKYKKYPSATADHNQKTLKKLHASLYSKLQT